MKKPFPIKVLDLSVTTVTLENLKSEKVCEMTVTSVTLTVIAQPSSLSAPLVAGVAGRNGYYQKSSFYRDFTFYLRQLRHELVLLKEVGDDAVTEEHGGFATA